ncbi:MAG: UDP-N-acetylmuramoyl-tripeptide--D-alanyl-D-alanine ligase [Ignavibacteria bacterium]|nr:UDP-N-acetylmuramoyl-tripeptide--D-alanyl-D-alanine ligase [Ignavibacteria bacterium]
MIKLDEILSLKNCQFINPENKQIKSFSGCSIDSRKIKSGELFIAIKGENTDGHNYLGQVFKKKVKGALVNRKWYKKNKYKFRRNIFFVIEDSVKSLGELARIHRNNFNVPVICIGGSNGKTTTKDLTGWVLNDKFNTLVSEGNYNNHIGLPLTLLKLNKNHEICVLETGSNHFNEMKYLCGISEPNFGLVTNIGREHLEFFKTLNGVAKEEFALYDYLLGDSRGNICFANYDDIYIKSYFRDKDRRRVFKYSYNYKTDVKGRFIKFDKNFQPEIEITFNSKKFSVKIPVFGLHSLYNGLSAVAVALYFGLTGPQIRRRIAEYRLLSSNRMEIIRKNGLLIINDTYNSNPDSVKLGLETVKKYKSRNKKHIVLADMLEMGKAGIKEHKAVGKIIREMNFENLYTYGKNSYYTFLSAGEIKNNFHFDSQNDMTSFLRSIVKEGDVVYVKGSRGMKMEKIVDNLINIKL